MGCVDRAVWEQHVEGLFPLLMLPGVKLPSMWAVRPRCSARGRHRAEAGVR